MKNVVVTSVGYLQAYCHENDWFSFPVLSGTVLNFCTVLSRWQHSHSHHSLGQGRYLGRKCSLSPLPLLQRGSSAQVQSRDTPQDSSVFLPPPTAVWTVWGEVRRTLLRERAECFWAAQTTISEMSRLWKGSPLYLCGCLAQFGLLSGVKWWGYSNSTVIFGLGTSVVLRCASTHPRNT